MELRQLAHFVAVVEERTFTRAATRSHLSQSALSASIRGLERELDTALFLRTTRHVELTDAGRALLPAARRALEAAREGGDAVHAAKGSLGGSLSLGGIQTTVVINQAELLARFYQRHPAVSLRYTTGTSASLIDEVSAGRIDVAFVVLPGRTPSELEARQLATIQTMLVCRPDHPFAGLETVDLDMLSQETFIAVPRSVTHGAVNRVLRAAGSRGHPPFEVSDVESTLEFVAHGLGVALLGRESVVLRPPLVAVPLTDPTMVWSVGVVTATARRRSPAASALLELLDEAGTAPTVADP
jgi:DNA-binding transcriptional LysR family regulator